MVEIETEHASEMFDNEIVDLVRDTRKMKISQQNAVTKLCQTADYLDEVWKDCRVANAVGNGAGVVGGLLTIAAGVVTVLSAGTATLIFFAGIAMGAAGAGINIATSYVEYSINSSRVEEAEKAVRDAMESAQKVMDTIERIKSTGRNGKMLFLTFLASKSLGVEVDEVVKNLLRGMFRSFGGSLVESGETVTTLATITTQAGGQVTFKMGANTLRNIMVGTSAAFVVLDALSLGFTIRDLIQGKKSEAAKRLRQKATEIRS